MMKYVKNSKIKAVSRNNIITLESYFLYFMAYSITGWLYEVFLETVVYRWGYSDRGILLGPYCPVYGVGALICVLLFYRFVRKGRSSTSAMHKVVTVILAFAGCMISATALEYAASYICEFLTGSWPWQTYFDYKWNFQGRIALSPSVRFGLGGLLFLYIFQPFFEKLNSMISEKFRHILAGTAAVAFAADVIFLVINASGML